MAVPPVSLVLDLFIFFVLNFLFYDARVKIICLYKLCLLYENCLFHPNIFILENIHIKVNQPSLSVHFGM